MSYTVAASDLASVLSDEELARQRQVRLIVMLDAARRAGLSPLPVLHLHALAYLANVLAPVWNMVPLDGKLLKQRRGPFYPDLQADLDRLVGMGIVLIDSVRHILNNAGQWQLEGDYALNYQFGLPVLAELSRFEDEVVTRKFIDELCLAISALTDAEIEVAFSEDATFSDPIIDVNNVIDFGEWRNQNASAAAANFFQFVAPAKSFTTTGEKIHLYMSHLRSRLLSHASDRRSVVSRDEH